MSFEQRTTSPIQSRIWEGVAVLLCPRCGWFRPDCVSMLNAQCPACGGFGLDCVDQPRRQQPDRGEGDE